MTKPFKDSLLLKYLASYCIFKTHFCEAVSVVYSFINSLLALSVTGNRSVCMQYVLFASLAVEEAGPLEARLLAAHPEH